MTPKPKVLSEVDHAQAEQTREFIDILRACLGYPPLYSAVVKTFAGIQPVPELPVPGWICIPGGKFRAKKLRES